MPLPPVDRARLIQAHGRNWRRDEVEWGAGWNWHMLGRTGTNRPGLRVCDFSYARGVYVLEWNQRPTYVGIARGDEGFRTRLTKHNKATGKKWNRFSWFSFDGVKDVGTKSNPIPDGWAIISDREILHSSGVNERIGEIEALLVGLLGVGLTNVQKPKFGTAQQWTQVVGSNFRPGGICHRVDPEWFVGRDAKRLSN